MRSHRSVLLIVVLSVLVVGAFGLRWGVARWRRPAGRVLTESACREFLEVHYCTLPGMEIIGGCEAGALREAYSLTEIGFKLPATCTPKEWLAELARHINSAQGYRYEALTDNSVGCPESEFNCISYVPETGEFRLFHWWPGPKRHRKMD